MKITYEFDFPDDEDERRIFDRSRDLYREALSMKTQLECWRRSLEEAEPQIPHGVARDAVRSVSEQMNLSLEDLEAVTMELN